MMSRKYLSWDTSFSRRRRAQFLPKCLAIQLLSLLFMCPNSPRTSHLPFATAYIHQGWSPDPIPTLSPRTHPSTIVQSQLTALQRNHLPSAYAYASPLNKKATGPLPRFAGLLQSPTYRDLIGHSRAEIVMEVSTPDDERWRCLVQVWSRDMPHGVPKEYWWALSRHTDWEESVTQGQEGVEGPDAEYTEWMQKRYEDSGPGKPVPPSSQPNADPQVNSNENGPKKQPPPLSTWKRIGGGGFVEQTDPTLTDVQIGCYLVDAVVPNRKLGEIDLTPGEL